MKHTPGEWRVIAHSIIIADESGICKLFGEGMNFGEQIANARLIAAAPDLLAACKSARFEMAGLVNQFGLGFTKPEEHPVIARLDAAIAKAEGEA